MDPVITIIVVEGGLELSKTIAEMLSVVPHCKDKFTSQTKTNVDAAND